MLKKLTVGRQIGKKLMVFIQSNLFFSVLEHNFINHFLHLVCNKKKKKDENVKLNPNPSFNLVLQIKYRCDWNSLKQKIC